LGTDIKNELLLHPALTAPDPTIVRLLTSCVDEDDCPNVWDEAYIPPLWLLCDKTEAESDKPLVFKVPDNEIFAPADVNPVPALFVSTDWEYDNAIAPPADV
jgi:hypothetical protein